MYQILHYLNTLTAEYSVVAEFDTHNERDEAYEALLNYEPNWIGYYIKKDLK